MDADFKYEPVEIITWLGESDRQSVINYHIANHEGCNNVNAPICLTKGGAVRSTLVNALTGASRFGNVTDPEVLIELTNLLEQRA